MKALLIDDERLARVELKRLLKMHPEVEVIGEASHIEEAALLVENLEPELLFLDIQMPAGSGFDLLQRLAPPHPAVIFTTAYDEFALRAFEVNALDYLLKPVAPARLAAALQKAALESPVRGTQRFEANSRVFLKDGDRCWLVPLSDIRLIESEGNHVRIHFETHCALLARSLGALEKRLPGSVFFRANRSQLVNVNHIENVEPWFSGCIRIMQRGGVHIELSRRATQEFRSRVGL